MPCIYNLNLNSMKSLKLFLAVAVIAVAFSSCSRDPKACFTVDVYNASGVYVPTTKGQVGERFYFSPMCSEQCFSSATLFEYGDGTTGTESGHVYSKAGSYTVTCKVFAVEHGTKGAKTDEAKQSITVVPSQAQAGL